MITNDSARQLGREAFAAGVPRIPSMDANLLAELRAAKVGQGIDPMKHWLLGWDAANLSEPVT